MGFWYVAGRILARVLWPNRVMSMHWMNCEDYAHIHIIERLLSAFRILDELSCEV